MTQTEGTKYNAIKSTIAINAFKRDVVQCGLFLGFLGGFLLGMLNFC